MNCPHCGELKQVINKLQAELENRPRECRACHRAIYAPTNEVPFWHDSDKFASFFCSETQEHHEPIGGQ